MEDLKEWILTYMKDFFFGFLFWGALLCCIFQSAYCYGKGSTGMMWLFIGLSVIVVLLAGFLIWRHWHKKRKK